MNNSVDHRAGILLGSNIDPEYHLPLAIQHLSEKSHLNLISSVWESPAVGSEGPNFLNAAVLISTTLNEYQVKRQVLHTIEKKLGRVRLEDKNAPRTIDLDIVIWDSQVLDEDLWKYPHVAVPIAEILPSFPSPISGKSIAQVAMELKQKTTIFNRGHVLLRAPWLAIQVPSVPMESVSITSALGG